MDRSGTSKAASNLVNQRGTGGGPNQTEKYETAEFVEGVENSSVVVFPASFHGKDKENEPPTHSIVFDDLVAQVLAEPSTRYKQITTPPPQKRVVCEEPTCSRGEESLLFKAKEYYSTK